MLLSLGNWTKVLYPYNPTYFLRLQFLLVSLGDRPLLLEKIFVYFSQALFFFFECHFTYMEIWLLIALWLTSSFQIGYPCCIPWEPYPGPMGSGPVCNICFGHWILCLALTLAHGATSGLASGCYAGPGSWFFPMAPWQPLQGYAHHDRWSLDPG